MKDRGGGDGESPVVAFTDSEGRKHEFTNYLGGANWYRQGYHVEILYDPCRPENAQISDWSSLWAITAIGIGTGTLFAICAWFAA